jgi:hypothetical protein
MTKPGYVGEEEELEGHREHQGTYDFPFLDFLPRVLPCSLYPDGTPEGEDMIMVTLR